MREYRLPWPPGVNRFVRRRWVPRDVLAFRESVVAEVWGGKYVGSLSGRLVCEIRCQPPDRRRRDLDNIVKPVLDALTSAEVWADDSQIDRLVVERMEPAKPGCVFVKVCQC